MSYSLPQVMWSIAGPVKRWVSFWILAITATVTIFMGALDATVVNIALPYIAGALSSTSEESTGVVTAYLVASAITVPATAWLARLYGRRIVLQVSIISFTASSVLCGFSPTLLSLVIFRIVQGLSNGPLQPLSQAMLLEEYPIDLRGKSMAFIGIGVVMSPLLGPVVGGWILQNYSWRWIFFINFPLGILSLILNSLVASDVQIRQSQDNQLDWIGFVLLVAWVAPLELALTLGHHENWFDSLYIIRLFLVSGTVFLLFVLHEWQTPSSVVDLRVLRSQSFALGCLLMIVLSSVFYGSLLLLPFWMQVVLEYPPLQAGMALAPRGLGTLCGLFVVARILGPVGPRTLICTGMALGAWTLFSLSNLSLDAGPQDFLWPQLLQGFAFSLLWVPLTTYSMRSVPKSRLQDATSIFTLIRNLGGGSGIAISISLLYRSVRRIISDLGDQISSHNRPAIVFYPFLRDPNQTQWLSRYERLLNLLQVQAQSLALTRMFRQYSILFLLAIPLVLAFAAYDRTRGTRPG